jgi:hypothetical protein
VANGRASLTLRNCGLLTLVLIVGCQQQSRPVRATQQPSTAPSSRSKGESQTKTQSPKFVGLAAPCAWRDDGSLWCWGRADALPPSGSLTRFSRQTHDGPRYVDCVIRPERVAIPGRVVTASVGWQHGCAIDYLGALWCWGKWKQGASGYPEPVKLPGKVEWVNTSLGTCVKIVGGSVYCWGAGSELLRAPFLSLSPQLIPELQDVRNLAFPSGALDNIAAIRKDGSLWVRGEWANATDWIPTGIKNLQQVWAGPGVCGRNCDGEIWCWGVAGEPAQQAIRVRELDGAIHVNFSHEAFCGIMREGGMRCCEFRRQSSSHCQFVRGLSRIKSGNLGVVGPGINYGFSEDGIDWYGSGCVLTSEGEVLSFGRDGACDNEVSDELFRAPQAVMPGELVSGDELDIKEENRRYDLRRKNR